MNLRESYMMSVAKQRKNRIAIEESLYIISHTILFFNDREVIYKLIHSWLLHEIRKKRLLFYLHDLWDRLTRLLLTDDYKLLISPRKLSRG